MGRNLAPLQEDNITDEILVRSANGDEGFASKLDIIKASKPLPEFMFLSGSNNFSVDGTIAYNNTIEYFSDEMRELDITTFVDFPIWSITEVERWNDTILFLIRENNTEYSYHLLALKGCFLINGVLYVSDSEHLELDVPLNTSLQATTVHSSVTSRGYFYCATRPSDTAIPPTRFTKMWKFNVYNLQDFKDITFDAAVNTQYRGNTTDLQEYKDNIYSFFVQTASRGASFVRINEDFQTFETMFTVGSSALEPTKVVRVDAPFIIYNNEVYFMTNDSTASSAVQRETIGVRVMGFDGIEKRYASVSIVTSFVANNPPVPHWMSVHNNKLIVHTGASTTTNNYKLLRIDCTTLAIEEVYDLPHRFTDDNTIMPNGLIYLNGESSGNDKRYTVQYDDFSTFALFSDTVGASIKNPVPRDEQLYKLSQFKNDGNGTSPYVTATQLATKQNTLIAGTNITIVGDTISATGGGSITIDSVPTDGSANAVSSNGTFDALATKEPTQTGTGFIYSTAGTKTYFTGGSGDILTANGAVANGANFVQSRTIGTSSATATPITTANTYREAVWMLQNQITAGALDGTLNKTANYTILPADFGRNGTVTVFVDATAGAVQIELPTPSNMVNRTVIVVKTDASANAVTVKGNSTTNINAANTYVISLQFENATVKTNGTQYYIVT